MTEEEKSHILSTHITMKSSKKTSPSATQKFTTPWKILLCADLGYVSEKPERIRASEINEFIQSKKIILRGNVKKAFESRDIFIEYPISSLKDFSQQPCIEQLSYTSEIQFLSATLHDVLQGRKTKEKARDILQKRQSTLSVFSEALALLQDAEKRNVNPQKSLIPEQKEKGPKQNTLDTIFSSMAIPSDSEGKDPLPSHTVVDGLVSALTSEDITTLPKHHINTLIEKCRNTINMQTKSLMEANFFSQCKSSWLCLRHTLKILGRNQDCTMFVYSSSTAPTSEVFKQTVGSLAEQGHTPDIILFDYPLSFSTAHMEKLRETCQCANAYKSMILAHCGQNEPFIHDLQNTDTIKPFFLEPRFIPLHRIRKNESARCCVLTIPPFVYDTKDDVPTLAGGSWIILINFVQTLVHNNSPFLGAVSFAETGITAQFPLRYAKGVTLGHTVEASEAGLTLLSIDGYYPPGIPVTTLIDPEIAAVTYTFFEYNLLINRILRGIGLFVQKNKSTVTSQELALLVKKQCVALLLEHQLFTSEDEVNVSFDQNRELSITIHSQQLIRSYPLRIDFSFHI